MATLSPLLQLLSESERAESAAEPTAYAILGDRAASLGQWALALKAFQFARRRGQHRPPTPAEWQVMKDFEELTILVDRASEYQRIDLLEWVCNHYAGHPDLHPQAVNASFAIIELGGAVKLDPVERHPQPNEAQVVGRCLDGDSRWLGWGLRHIGAPLADRILRLGLQGIEPFHQCMEQVAHWVEIIEGPQAAVPYYRALFDAGVGDEAIRLALIMASARGNRPLALQATRNAEERSRLGLWVLRRGLSPEIDRRWLQDLGEDDLETLVAQEADQLSMGLAPRVRAKDLRFSSSLAGRFQPLFLAHGHLAEVITCLEIRLRDEHVEDRPLLLRMQAGLFRDLGQDEQAKRAALAALDLAPEDPMNLELVVDLAQQSARAEAFVHALVQHGRACQSAALIFAGAGLAGAKGLTLLEELAAFEVPVEELIDLAVSCDQRLLGLALLAELAEVSRLSPEQNLAVARDLISLAAGKEEMLEQALRLLDQLWEEDERAQRLRVSALLELGRGHEALVVMHEGDFPKEGAWAVHRARALMQVGEPEEAGQLLELAEAQGSAAAVGLLARLRESR